MLARAARWVLISVAGTNVAIGALVACMLVGGLTTPVADRLHLPFAAVAILYRRLSEAGFFPVQRRDRPCRMGLARAKRAAASADQHRHEPATAFLMIMAMTIGLILPRLLFERVWPAAA